MAQNNDIVVRFPPSPTGFLHIGNARTFLFNYLFAKKHAGKIVFRLEDTDKERSKKEYEDDIINNLKWLNIEPDFSTTVRQSERGDIYKKYLEEMIKKGFAYLSKEDKTDENKRSEVIRFKNPNKKIRFTDEIRGEIEFDTTELGDFVLAKSLSEPIYHLAVVVDDFEMGVTHIIRGEDGISNTSRQILVQEAIGAPRPIYAHLPLILASDKTKLSKRKHGEQVSVTYYRNLGYLNQALVNYLALVGWNPGLDKDIFNKEDLIKLFDLKKVQKKGGIFDIEKLNWVNRQYILQQTKEEQIEYLLNYIKNTQYQNHHKLSNNDFINNFLNLVLERISFWGEVEKNAKDGEYDYLFYTPKLDTDNIKWKKSDNIKAKIHLEKAREILRKVSDKNKLKDEIKEYAEKEGKGDVLWPIRYSLSGREKSPDPFTLLDILEKDEVDERLSNAINLLK